MMNYVLAYKNWMRKGKSEIIRECNTIWIYGKF